jgi:enoyl-CoA hydratase/carnithine racemase
MDHGPLLVAADGGVVTVTIDFPPLNVLGGEIIGALLGLLPQLEADPTIRVVVFRSADPDFFLMHGDVEVLVAVPASEYEPVTAPNIAAATFQRLTAEPFVTIGVLDGGARGGGCEFLSALDLRIGSPRAVIGQPEVPMGILPGAGGTVRWPRVVGRARALEILLTGRDVSADEALALGWLQAVVPSERLDDEAARLARRIARMPPKSIAAVKRIVDRSLAGLDDALVAESDALHQLMAGGAHIEPMRRFLAAGGQTREGETAHMASLLDAMLDGSSST